MRTRLALIVATVLLLCGLSQGKPRKKRSGTFAAYIDPAAPEDPPRPKPKSLSVVLLIDKSGLHHDSWRSEAAVPTLEVLRNLTDNDRVAVLAFSSSVDVVLKPTWASEVARIAGAVLSLKPARDSNLTAALDEARWYVSAAPGHKVIVLLTSATKHDEKLDATLAAIRTDKIELIVVGMSDSDGHLWRVAEPAGGKLFLMTRELAGEIRALHNP